MENKSSSLKGNEKEHDFEYYKILQINRSSFSASELNRRKEELQRLHYNLDEKYITDLRNRGDIKKADKVKNFKIILLK